MLFQMLELLRDQPAILVLFTFGLAGIFGGIPPMLERARRRKIENDLPAMLEALADSMGAGLGLQSQAEHARAVVLRRRAETAVARCCGRFPKQVLRCPQRDDQALQGDLLSRRQSA